MPTDDYEDEDRPRRPRSSRGDEDEDRPRRRRDEDEDEDRDDFDDVPRRRKSGGNGLAITSMILGIVSLVMVCCCAWISPLLGIPAVVLGVVGSNKGQSKGMAMAGIITGALGTLAAIVLIILALTGTIKPVDIRQLQNK